ncbi:MAG: DNA repair protein RecO [Anaerolineae bacterium]|jgi:DNA repair protein RecO (recombination protein O)
MTTGRLYRTEGIVIGRRDQGEADRVLRLCTPAGKTDVLAKGARKVGSRKAGHIELFTRSAFVLSRVPNYWDIISQAETIDPHTELRSDLLRGTYARYAVELLDRFFTEGEGSAALFDLLDHTLTWLCEQDGLDTVARFYEQHLLGLAGFRPELFRCVGKHEGHLALRIEAGGGSRRPLGFAPEQGGALCPDCYEAQKRERDVRPLSPHALDFLQACQRSSFTSLAERSIPPSLHEQVEGIMQHYIRYHLEQDVKAGAFLQQIKHVHP